MTKLQQLRAHLLGCALGISADELLTFAESGTVTRYPGADASFSVQYQGLVIITGFTGNTLHVFLAVSNWVQDAMPGAPPDALKFFCDHIDHTTVDLQLKLQMTDVIKAEAITGGTELTPQPDPADPIDMAALLPPLQ